MNPTLTLASVSGVDRAVDRSMPGLEVWNDEAGAVVAVGYREHRRQFVLFPGLVRFQFSADSDQILAQHTSQISADSVADLFHRCVLPMVLQEHGFEVLHASAVADLDGAAAFCGVSGTGKSTLAAVLSRRGLAPWSDDCLVVDSNGSRLVSRFVPFEFRLLPNSVAFLADLSGTARESSDRRGTSRELPVKALFALNRSERADEPIVLRRVEPALALMRLLPHAFSFDFVSTQKNRRMIENYSRIASTVPVFDLTLPTDFNRLPEIADLLQSTLKTVSS